MVSFASRLAWVAVVAIAAAQSAFPAVNDTKDGLLPPLTTAPSHSLVLSIPSIKKYTVLIPLTEKARDDLPNGPDSAVGLNGHLVVNDPSTSKMLTSSDFAYTNCNASDPSYAGDIGLSTVIGNAIEAKAAAIVFYTTDQDYCKLSDVSGYGKYISLYSMEIRNESSTLLQLLKGNNFSPQEAQTIFTVASYKRYLDSQGSFSLGGTGSTAVAMIILYSITGVITALFLIIIITGAIRAHRHPERYGPRNVLGRARQSRAKGIARAMLDTIPIVKFGEKAPNGTEEAKDLEANSSFAMEDRSLQPSDDGTTQDRGPQATAGASEGQQIASSSAVLPNVAMPPTDTAKLAEDGTDEALGCSICTDDFELGQDIRVLPCNHKFHPACVDPWLLDVSGTCPLCRVDLHPVPELEGQDGSESDPLPPPLDPTDGTGATGRRRDTLRGFISTRLNRTGIQGTSREERIEILRRWREANRSPSATTTSATTTTAAAPHESAADSAAEETRRENRLGRFSRLMRRRDR